MSVSLKSFNTLSLAQNCQQLFQVNSVDEFKGVYQNAISQNLPVMILGGGSNVVFTSDFDGVVIKVDTKGIEVYEDNEYVYLTVQAGENWHSFVQFCLKNGFHGLENLALIPGSVGASPIQNIGAYGVEMNQFCEQVTYLDLACFDSYTLTSDECHFGYRESIFKSDLKNKALITEVQFKLPKLWQPKFKIRAAAAFKY